MGREPGQQARDYRHCVDVTGTVTRADGEEVEVWITDMSLGGCRVSSSGTLWIGEHVLLQMPGFAPMQARVKWALAGKAGLQFEDVAGAPPLTSSPAAYG